MTMPRGWELILVVLVIVLLFGARRLPDAARSVGRSLRIFKAETKGLTDDDTATDAAPVTAATPPPPAAIPAPAESLDPKPEGLPTERAEG
jgi:sec-independent protein translocase protein TatA